MQNVTHSSDDADPSAEKPGPDGPQPKPVSTPADDESHHPAGDPNAPDPAGDYSR